MRPIRTHSLVTPTFDTIANWLTNHGRVLDGNISYGQSNTDRSRNIVHYKANGVSPGAANTDFTITHNLGYVPVTIIGQDTNNGGLLYRGSVAWTKTTITLRCTTTTATYNVWVA
jgi:hypothetical protein